MKAVIIDHNGVKGIEINGQAFCFAATRSFRPEGRILHDFSEHGFKFFNIFPSGIMTALGKRTIPYSQFGPVWIGEGQYNWDNLRAQCDEILGHIGPDTYISLSVHLDPPPWFVDSHPGMVDHWEQMIQNIGCEAWKKAAAAYMCALIDKMDEWYPDRVYAIFLLCGGTTEWYSYHADTVVEHPTELQQQAFAAYMNDPKARIPAPEVLHHAEDGFLRHPIKDKAAIDYWRFTNDSVVDTILHFARVAKEHTGGTRLVGLFYAQVYGTLLDWSVRMSYNQLDRVLASPDIDMIFSPASYVLRKLESTSGIRVPVDSISLAGKLFVHEVDSSTHLLKKKQDGAFQHAVGRDEAFTCTSDSKMYIRREAGMAIAKGQGYWWFDMFSGYYDDPELMQELQRIREIQEEAFQLGGGSVSEMCILLDADSNYLVRTGSYFPMPEHQLSALYRIGAPIDQGLTSDLMVDRFADRYKLFIFPALFGPKADVRQKIAALRAEGKNMLFLHAPGYITEQDFSTEAMQQLTGIHFTRQELADNTVVGEGAFAGIRFCFDNHYRQADTWRNPHPPVQISPVFSADDLDEVYFRFAENGQPAAGIKYRKDGGFDAFCACAPAPVELMRKLAKLAGVFAYTDHAEPVYTNEGFECAYSYAGGERTLYRKENSLLTDRMTGESFEVGPEGTKVHFEPHETKLFLVQKL